jgi:V/A-type H+-transporting ATPase subunit E
MTGLEKILKHIEEDALQAADKIITEAECRAKEITDLARVTGEQKCAKINLESRQQVDAYLSRSQSAALLQEKKMILDVKQQLIQDVIAKGKEYLRNLPDQEYFDIILKMIKKYSLNKSGEIVFSMHDRERLPKKFDHTLQKELKDKEDASLTVSDSTRDFDGGFILIYGDVEENCTFDALIAAARESLQDKINKFLFE